jgi:histidine kinase
MLPSSRHYEVHERIAEGPGFVRFRGTRRSDGVSVVLELRTVDFADAARLARFRHEARLLQGIGSAQILRLWEVEETNSGLLMVWEDWAGEPSSSAPLSLEAFWLLAGQAARALEAVHDAGLVHGALRPGSFRRSRDGTFQKLSDFAFIEEFTAPALRGTAPGELAFYSPEQTGRLQRGLDARSDLYSLGLTWWAWLAGEPPWDSQDPLEIIHAQLARQPRPVHELRSDLPPVLSDLIAKLTAKDPEARYQTASGLRRDLERAREACAEQGPAARIPLGLHDAAGRLLIPDQLYGREEELRFLMESFVQAATGAARWAIVSGVSGQGKSGLVWRLQKPIVERRAAFAAGKYELHSQDKPYSALAQALGALLDQFLLADESSFRQTREAILEAVEGSGQVVVDVIPTLELLMGPQPEVASLGPEANEARFNMIFKKFLRALARPDRPVALFLDDLQWADAASLRLFEQILADEGLRYFHFIGAYRDNEVGPGHALQILLRNAQSARRPLDRLELKPLGDGVMAHLLEETLARPRAECIELATLLTRKTRGNPFFAQQLLKSLHRSGALCFSDTLGWQWDLDAVRAANPTDNVLDLMDAKLRALDPAVTRALSVASCLGNTFGVEEVASILGEETAEVYGRLASAEREGLILRKGGLFKFHHDRIQEAAHAVLGDDERARVHWEAGRRWVEFSANDKALRRELIFAIVSHLNQARVPAHAAGMDAELARLNALAAERSIECLAYRSALESIDVALEILGPTAWDDDYGLTYRLRKLQCSALYLSGDYAGSELVVDAALEHARDVLDRAALLQEKMRLYLFLNRTEDAFKLGLATLHLLGLEIPAAPSQGRQLLALLKGRWMLAWRGIDRLPELSPAGGEHTLALSRTLVDVAPYAFLMCSDALFIIMMELSYIMMQKGNSVYTPYSCCGLALGMIAGFGDYVLAHQIMQAGFRINERYPDSDIRSKITMIYLVFVKYWREPLTDIEDSLKLSLSYTIAAGDKAYGTYAGIYTAPQRVLYARDLTALLGNFDAMRSFIITANVSEAPESVLLSENFIRFLQGDPEGTVTAAGRAYDVDAFYALTLRQMQLSLNALIAAFEGMRLYYRGEWAAAAEYLDRHIPGLGRSPGLFFHYGNRLFAALAHAEGGGTRTTIRRVRALHRQLVKFAAGCPENFRAGCLLVEAQLRRLEGKPVMAEALFERAIADAAARGWTAYEALANECYGRFLLARGRERFAGTAMREAWRLYRRWGALGQAARLRERHPTLFAGEGEGFSVESSRAPGEAPPRDIDLTAVVRASRALSGEIVFESLLKRLLTIILESGGAQRAVLVLDAGEAAWHVRAEAHADAEAAAVDRPLAQVDQLPQTLVQYVLRTGKSVVLADAATDATFGLDPYWAATGTCSALCAPITNQGRLLGAVYLENSLGRELFTAQRLEVVSLLAAQAAVSLENARVYATLERRVEERATELKKKTKDMEALLDNVRQGICLLGEDLVVQPGHSAHLAVLFGTPNIAGTRLERMLRRSRLPLARRYMIVEACRSMIGGDRLGFDLNSHHLPKELNLPEGAGGAMRDWELDWVPVEDDDGIVRKIMLSIRDVTELRQVRQLQEAQEREIELIRHLLHAGPGAFASFLANARDLLTQARETPALSLHTLKGNARTLGLRLLADEAHAAESTLTTGSLQFDGLEHVLNEYAAAYARVFPNETAIGTNPQRLEAVREFARVLREWPPQASLIGLEAAFGQAFYPSLREVLTPCLRGLRPLAERLGKHEPMIEVRGGEVRVAPEDVARWEGIFNHLLANTLVHGCEPSRQGRIELQMEGSAATGWQLSYSDDGAGLDLERLRAKARSAGLAEAEMSHDQSVAELVFREGISTAELSEVAGRGVGLAAVRDAICKMGGQMRIQLRLAPSDGGRRPFVFVMELPVTGLQEGYSWADPPAQAA